MTIVELKKDLSEARVSLNQGDVVTAKRVEAWAAALERAERDHPDRSLALQRDATPRSARQGR